MSSASPARLADLSQSPGIAARMVAAAPLACALIASLHGCVPPELVTATGASGGASGSGSGLTGEGAGGAFTTTWDPAGGSGGAPPPLCTDEACRRAGGQCITGACVITCAGTQSCLEPVICPENMPCVVECKGAESCAAGVDCSKATQCDILCEGPGSCGGPTAAQMTCPDGPCDLECGQGACVSVSLTCGADGCSAECLSNACQSLTCAGDCSLKCLANDACGAVTCSSGPCEIQCASTGTCDAVTCSGDECAITCEGNGSCAEIDCQAACACAAACSSPALCITVVCPQDSMMGDGPCHPMAGKGCIDTANCSTCP